MDEQPAQPTARPRLVIVNPSYITGHKMKCRLGDAPEFAACGSLVGRASPELRRVVAESAAASAVLRRYHRIMWTGYCISMVGGALLGLCIACGPFILVLLPDDWTALANTILSVLWPVGLCILACGLTVDYASYRCFRNMVEVYNQSLAGQQEQPNP